MMEYCMGIFGDTIFDGNSLYMMEYCRDFVRFRQNRVKDGNPRWHYLEFSWFINL